MRHTDTEHSSFVILVRGFPSDESKICQGQACERVSVDQEVSFDLSNGRQERHVVVIRSTKENDLHALFHNCAVPKHGHVRVISLSWLAGVRVTEAGF